jgi:hypothetical protein
LLGALARHYQDEGPNVTIVVRPGSKVITMGVVDYVAVADLTKDEIKNLVHTNQLRIAEIPAIERWPEEVIIGEETYQRADLAFTTPSAKVSAKREIPRNGHTWTLEQVVEETAQRTGGRGRKSLHSPGSLHKT